MLEEISKKPELQKEFRFYLYFKSQIPDDAFLANPIFVKKVLKLPFLRPSFNIFFHILLPFAYLKDRLDAMFFASFMLPAFFSGKSLVVLTNDIHYEYTKGNLPWRYKLAYRLFSNWAARRATLLTTFTQAAKDEIVNLFKVKPQRITVNYLGVDFFAQTRNYKLEPKTYLLYVGQALPRRRVKETIQAFEILAPKLPELKLVVIGEDKYNPPVLKKLTETINKKLGSVRIIYHDYIKRDEDLVRLYSQAKLFIYISSSEAMGLPPLEALAYGTPPIVKDNPLNREIYQGNAFYVQNEKDPVEISETIEKALNDEPKQKEIIQNASQILNKFSWQKHTERFLEIIRAGFGE